MEAKHKELYESPAAEVVELRMVSCILGLSESNGAQRDSYGDADEI